MKNEKIIESWNKIEPNEETKLQIFNKITQKQQQKKLPKFKRIMIVAAVMACMLILMSAAVYVYNEIIFYDMNGNIRGMEMSYFTNYDPDSEESIFEHELWKNLEENAVLFISMPSQQEFRRMSGNKTIKDYDEFKNYLQNNGAEQFDLPEYLPKGYYFDYANVNFTLINDTNYEELEPVYSEEKFGNIYEKYLLPENQTRIDRVDIYYSNGKLTFYLNIRFEYGDINGIVFGSSIPYDKPEILDIPQFEKSILLSRDGYGLLNMGRDRQIKAIKLINDKFNIFDISFINKRWREKQNLIYLSHFETMEVQAVCYDITVWSNAFSGLSRDEIIKIAESIK